MVDVFIERMVKKKMETKDILITLLIVVGATVLVAAGIFIVFPLTGQPILAFFILIGACFGGYKLLTMRSLEYEYSLTNGYVSIDKIINRSSRKRITSFECKDVEDIGEYPKNEARLKNRDMQTKIFASEYADGRNSWFVIVNTTKTGKTLLVFDPDEDMQEAVKKFIPSHLRFEVFGRSR